MSYKSFLIAWQMTGRSEGGFVNNPFDKGGPTNHGITEAVARANGYLGDMRELPKERALDIAKRQYWDILKLDDLELESQKIAFEIFDTAILCGVGTSGTFLQLALNKFNRSNRTPPDYPDVAVDGVIGPATVHTLRTYLDKRGSDGEVVMLRALNSLQCYYMLHLPEFNEEFMFGWVLNRVVI
jgi:lysozyme family protein